MSTQGANGVVTLRYQSRFRRFRGGAVTRRDGYIIHTFTSDDKFRPRRPWRLWTVPVEYLVIGGGGGGASTPGRPGDSLAGTTTPTGPFDVIVGKGGAPGSATRPAGAGGGSRFTEACS